MLLMLWLEGKAAFSVLMLSAAVHEIGHILAMKILGYRARRVDILPMGALIVCPEGVPDRDEVIIALAGPIASLLTALVSFAFFAVNGDAISLFCSVINLSLGAFNLLPVEKLDGGKALCCFLSHRKKENGRRICSAASVCSKMIFLSIAMLCAVCSGFNLGVIVLSAALLLQLQ